MILRGRNWLGGQTFLFSLPETLPRVRAETSPPITLLVNIIVSALPKAESSSLRQVTDIQSPPESWSIEAKVCSQ